MSVEYKDNQLKLTGTHDNMTFNTQTPKEQSVQESPHYKKLSQSGKSEWTTWEGTIQTKAALRHQLVRLQNIPSMHDISRTGLLLTPAVPWRCTHPLSLQAFLSAFACGLSLCLSMANPHIGGSARLNLAPWDIWNTWNISNEETNNKRSFIWRNVSQNINTDCTYTVHNIF